MQKRRTERLAEEIRREISGILTESIKDPRLSLVSVSRVDVTNDLGHARVYISVLGDETKQKEAEESLNKAKGFIRSEVSNRIRLRHAPEISFRIDHSIEHGIRISNMLDEMATQEHKQDEE
ncbi:MAG: 30S ribosome-binding factor RbfA [Solirubrobacterales bacterium]